jgi:hypothetical protein
MKVLARGFLPAFLCVALVSLLAGLPLSFTSSAGAQAKGNGGGAGGREEAPGSLPAARRDNMPARLQRGAQGRRHPRPAVPGKDAAAGPLREDTGVSTRGGGAVFPWTRRKDRASPA